MFYRDTSFEALRILLINSRTLHANLIVKKNSVHLYDTPKWQLLNKVKPQLFMFGQHSATAIETSAKLLEIFKELVVSVKYEKWQCDIQDIHGLSDSKSNLWEFSSLNELVETNSKEMINEITVAKLQKNLAHDQIRIINAKHTNDHFVRHQWDGRLFLVNGGGSHHLAAARYIASKLNIKVPLHAGLKVYTFAKDRLAELENLNIYLLNSDAEFFYAFKGIMKSYECSFIEAILPPNLLNGARIVIIDKTEIKAQDVNNLFETNQYFNLGKHWNDIASQNTFK